MISFKLRPHLADSTVEVVEVYAGNRLLAVLYPGTGPDGRERNALRIESRHFADNAGEVGTKIVRFTDD